VLRKPKKALGVGVIAEARELGEWGSIVSLLPILVI
jgi:hypothetical protein